MLVLEELDSVVEDNLYHIAGEKGLPIHGRRDGFTNIAGEYGVELCEKWIASFLGLERSTPERPSCPRCPAARRCCARLPHRASFYSVKQAMKGKRPFSRGTSAAIPSATPNRSTWWTPACAWGLHHHRPGHPQRGAGHQEFRLCGDSTFFHTGIPGVINAVYNQTDITIIVLDNSTTCHDRHQPHPGTRKTMMWKSLRKSTSPGF